MSAASTPSKASPNRWRSRSPHRGSAVNGVGAWPDRHRHVDAVLPVRRRTRRRWWAGVPMGRLGLSEETCQRDRLHRVGRGVIHYRAYPQRRRRSHRQLIVSGSRDLRPIFMSPSRWLSMSIPVKIAVGLPQRIRSHGEDRRGGRAPRRGKPSLAPASTSSPRKRRPAGGSFSMAPTPIIMGAPTYMGSLSAPFKAFMDATLASPICRESAGRGKSRRRLHQWGIPRRRQAELARPADDIRGPAPDALGQSRDELRETTAPTPPRTSSTATATRSAWPAKPTWTQGGDVAPPPRRSSDGGVSLAVAWRRSAQELSAGRAALGRPVNRGVPGGADKQDPEGRGVTASARHQATTGLVTA